MDGKVLTPGEVGGMILGLRRITTSENLFTETADLDDVLFHLFILWVARGGIALAPNT